MIKGLAGSGVQIVSISERTPDFETIRPKIKRWFELLTSPGPYLGVIGHPQLIYNAKNIFEMSQTKK